MAELRDRIDITVEELEESLGAVRLPRFIAESEKSFVGRIDTICDEICSDSNKRAIFVSGPTSSGKTTFTTALCKVLGVTDPVGSPTFAIVNEYVKADGDPMYHFDFYRINKPAEAIEIGLYDYLDSGCLCIMEWPENIEELLPEETLKVSISVNPDQSRTLEWEDA